MCLNKEEFEKLNSTVSILGIFLTATEEMSAEKYPSIFKVIPIVTMLKGIVDRNTSTLARNLSRYIKIYFGNNEKEILLIRPLF